MIKKSSLLTIKKGLQPHARRLVDLPTIPPEILDTSTRPDMVIIEEQQISLVELTVPWWIAQNLMSKYYLHCCLK